MTIRLNPIAADVGTLTGVATTGIVSLDLSALSIDNAHVYIQYLLTGVDTTTFASVRFLRACSYSRIAGAVAQLDVAPLNLSTDYVNAALVGTAPVMAISGNSIVGQATNIVGKTVRYTGRLWVYTTDM